LKNQHSNPIELHFELSLINFNATWKQEKHLFLFILKKELCSRVNNTTDTIPSLHLLKSVVDVGEFLAVRDEFVDLELAVQVVVDQVGQL
jgi:hypothetical protein